MSDPSSTIATRSGCARQDEVNLINQEITKLRLQFHEKHVALLRRLNSLQSSTRAVPPETLSLIFQHVLDSHETDRDRDPQFPRANLELGHISSYWRGVLWSTPTLWSDLTMVANRKNIHTVTPLLQLFLRNVGHLPLSVHLTFFVDVGPLSASAESLDSIASVLFDEIDAAKIQSLHLSGAPWEWTTRFSLSNLSSLKFLDLMNFEGERQDSDVVDLAEVPCLSDMVLKAPLSPMGIEFCWAKITSLDLWEVPIDTCLKLLINCPNLIIFITTDPEPASSTSTTSNLRLRDTITLNHLETFEWRHHHDPRCLVALRQLRFPALRELAWINEPESPREELPFGTLIPNLPPTLSSLRLCFSRWTAPFLKGVFERTRHVEKLTIEACPVSTVAGVLYTLTADTDDHRMLLPFLKKMLIMDAVIKDKSGRHFCVLILHFLRNRFRQGCSEFCLKFVGVRFDWPLEIQEELCRMREKGFKLEIRHEYRRHWNMPVKVIV